MTTVADRVNEVEKDVVSIKTRLTGVDGRLKGIDIEISEMRRHMDEKFDKSTNSMIIWMIGIMSVFTAIQALFIK